MIALVQAEGNRDWKISGYGSVDIFHIIKAAELTNNNFRTGDIDELGMDSVNEVEGANGFAFRRIYLGFEKKIGSRFKTKLRFEMKNGYFDEKVNDPFVKDAYLQWQYAENHSATIGIQGPPTFAIIEKLWGYRFLEKTADDFFGIRSSRDFGLAFKGQSTLDYHFMIANGKKNNSEGLDEQEQSKVAYLSLSKKLADQFIVEVFGDVQIASRSADEQYTAQGFFGYKSSLLRAGVQLTHQQKATSTFINLLSIPVVINFSDSLVWINKYDRYVNHTQGNLDGKIYNNYFMSALDYIIDEQVHIIPNVMAFIYDTENYTPSQSLDLITRVTIGYFF
jgi:hypothetical protein